MSLFYYGIDVLLVNALIYHNDPLPPACKQSQKDIRMSIIECFVGRSFSRSNRSESRKRAERTPPNILPPARLIGQNSLQRRETQRYCGWCYKTQGGRQSKHPIVVLHVMSLFMQKVSQDGMIPMVHCDQNKWTSSIQSFRC